jgi:hypothetical protein
VKIIKNPLFWGGTKKLGQFKLYSNVNFVALKNGMHCGEGYNYFN